MMLKYVSGLFLKIGDSAVWGGYFAASLGWLISFILPIKDFLILTTALVILDLITGVVAAKKRGEKIRSRALMRTTIKLLLYYCAILATQGVQVVFAEKIPLSYITAFTIAITELKSLLENVDAGTGSRLAKMIVEKLTNKSKQK
jgi:phage-related holin